MQTTAPLPADRRFNLRLDLPDADASLETTGYIAWADALGRAGVRFSDLPTDARQRLDQWLALNDETPSRKAPKLTLDRILGPAPISNGASNQKRQPRSISLESSLEGSAEGIVESEGTTEMPNGQPIAATIQFEFHSLGSDLNTALRVISERAQTLLRGSGAAIALMESGPMMCRASVGNGGPPLGTHVDVNAGFSGECIRRGKPLRCDNTETDSRVAAEVCRRLGIRSIAAAPIRYERDVVGIVEVFSSLTFAFDEGDLAVLERLAQTALLTLSQTRLFGRT